MIGAATATHAEPSDTGGPRDVDAVSRRLAGHIPGLRLERAHVVSDSPGKRQVIAYSGTDGSGHGVELIGKAYVDASRARRLHDTLTLLSTLNRAEAGVPRPVALLSDLGLSLQERVSGRTLDQLDDPARVSALGAAARWLSRLHAVGFAFERRVNPASERRKMSEWSALVAQHLPDVAAVASALQRRLDTLAPLAEMPGSAPIHKDFHYQHVLVSGDGVRIIDLDEVRSGEPGHDVAHFSAYLWLLSLREERSQSDARAFDAAFADAYGRADLAAGAPYRFFRACCFLKIAKQLVRGKGPAPAPQGEALAEQVRLALAEGMCAIE